MNEDYMQTIQALRDEREERVRENPVNWLSLVGLIPLSEGENRFESEIGLPGVLTLHGNRAILSPAAGSDLLINGAPVKEASALVSDADGEADKITCGSLVASVIRRGEKHFLRVWDTQAKALKDFHGYHYFPIQPEYCIQAEFVPFDPPRVQPSLDVIGTPGETTYLGEVHFTWQGKACILLAADDDGDLLFDFRDETRRDSTYPGGRRLTASKPSGLTLTLDFNLALNWPCAYTAFATCPLPPFENRLAVRIEAGEMCYHD